MNRLEKLINEIDRPTLFIGKGPSYNLKSKILLSKYYTVCLNHAVRDIKCDAVSIIDIDVVRKHQEDIYNNADSLIIPYYPHDPENGFKPTDKTIENYADEMPFLKKLLNEDRVYSYNASSSTKINGDLANFNVHINNGDSLFGIFSKLGVKSIYSIGLDGGTIYSSSFKDLTPGENGQTFDKSLDMISEMQEHYGSELIKIGDLEEVKVFVGSTPSEDIPTLVLDYSIKKHTHHPCSIVPLHTLPTEHRMPIDVQSRPRTPFSFKRFFIPQLTTGRAFYMDSDMIVFDDMGKLLESNFDGADGICCKNMDKFNNWQTSNYAFLLLDCDNVEWSIDSIIDQLDAGDLTYEQLMFEFKHAKIKPDFEYTWNSLDLYEKDKTKLLHYTDMNKQPWKHPNHPHENLWLGLLKEAVQCGYIDKKLVIDHGNTGNIRQFR